MAVKEIYEIPLGDIEVRDTNVRRTNRKAEVKELAKSIEKYDLIQPVVLRGLPEGKPPYELIVGQRRFLAHKELKRKTIDATFSGQVDDTQAKILSLTENMHRVELNHADKAEAITALYLRYSRNDKSVAKELGLSPRTVREYIRIEEMATQEAKDLLRRRKISKADVRRVIDAAQGDTEKANRLLNEMPKLSKYEKDRAVDYGKRHPKALTDEIIEDAKIARIQPTIILNLAPEIEGALGKARKRLSMGNEAIAAKALSEWLERNGFLKPGV